MNKKKGVLELFGRMLSEGVTIVKESKKKKKSERQ